jgi:hypothetical protein
MKKYILGIFALLLVVGFSAFKIVTKNSEAKKEATYWFLMNASGTTITTTQVTDPSDLCPLKINPDCARQYNESQTEEVLGVRQVKAAEVNSQIDFRSKDQ